MNKTVRLSRLILAITLFVTPANAKSAYQGKLVNKYNFTKTVTFIESQITEGIIPGAKEYSYRPGD